MEGCPALGVSSGDMEKKRCESQTTFPPQGGWMGKVSRAICFLSDFPSTGYIVAVGNARGDAYDRNEDGEEEVVARHGED